MEQMRELGLPNSCLTTEGNRFRLWRDSEHRRVKYGTANIPWSLCLRHSVRHFLLCLISEFKKPSSFVSLLGVVIWSSVSVITPAGGIFLASDRNASLIQSFWPSGTHLSLNFGWQKLQQQNKVLSLCTVDDRYGNMGCTNSLQWFKVMPKNSRRTEHLRTR